VRPLVLALAALVLAGCGGSHRQTVAGCLNDAGFLVSGSARQVEGTTSDGVAFTLTVYGSAAAAHRAAARLRPKTTAAIGRGVVDWHGNPSPSARPTGADLRAVERWVRRAGG